MENQYEKKLRHTKNAIHEALIELSQKKDIQKITILELCSLAGINRSTFYKYYGSQYDVLTEMGDAFWRIFPDNYLTQYPMTRKLWNSGSRSVSGK